MKYLLAALVFLSPFAALADETINWAASNNSQTNFGAATGIFKDAMSFTAAANFIAVNPTLCIFKEGSPADNAVIAIQADSAGQPSGTDLASISISGASLGSSCTVPSAQGTISYSGTAATIYWVVLQRSGSLSDANKYDVMHNTTVSPNMLRFYSSAWNNDGQGSFQGSLFVTEPSAFVPSLVLSWFGSFF